MTKINYEIKFDLTKLHKSVENAIKAIRDLERELEKVTPITKPKWWQFWKWDWSLLTERPPVECYQPNVDNTGKPPKGGSGVQIYYKTNEPCIHNCSGLCKESC